MALALRHPSLAPEIRSPILYSGLPNDFQQTNATPNDLRSWIMSFYVQDSFKVSSRIW